MAKDKVNQSPQLGLNGLAKYVSATARQRRTILHDEKYPPDFKVVYYREAVREIQRYLVDSERQLVDLVEAAKRLVPKPTAERHEKARVESNASAIRAFSRIAVDLPLDALTPTKGPQQGAVMIEGVRISVRPEVLLRGTHRKEECAGGVKLYLSKTIGLTDDGASVAAALLKRHCEAMNHDCRHHNRHIVVVDVFTGKIFQAPKAIKAIGHELNAICNEIARLWPTI